MSSKTHQPIKDKNIVMSSTPLQSLWGKLAMNSFYGAYGGSLGTNMPISVRQAGKLLRSMKGISRNLRTVGFEYDTEHKHAIKNVYPYDYVSCNRDLDIPFEEHIKFLMKHTTFERRISAEIYRLNLLISYYRKRKNQYKLKKPKYRGGQQRYGKFEGYHNEVNLKKKNKIENTRLQKIIDGYIFELENIEEEHPEWLF